MASIPVKPQRPVINWRHPLTRGLVFDLPLWEGSGNPKELVGKQTGTLNGGLGWSKNLVGKSLNWTGSHYINFSSYSSYQPNKPFSYFAVINPVADGTNPRAIRGDGTAANGPEFRIETNDKLGLIKQNVINIGSSTGTITNGVINTVGVTYDASGNYVFYINGKKDSFGTNNQTLTVTANYIGEQTGGTPEYFKGHIFCFRTWNRILTPKEYATLHSNPWVIYSQPKSTYSNAVTSVSVSPPILTGLYTIPTPTITTIQNITVSPSVVIGTYTIPTPTITTTSGSTSSYVFNAIDTGIYMFQVGGGAFV